MRRCAVFSCMGFGDGLIALVLSNNLQLNGYGVTTYHPFLRGLQGWFPHLPLRPFPSIDELQDYDRFFIFYEKSPRMKAILEHCEKHYPDKTTVLNPIATPRRDYPYWEGGRFEGNRPFVENLYLYCKDILKFPVASRSNGVHVPEGIKPRRYEKRVIFHPMSSRLGKNWSPKKFLLLANKLEKRGFEPVFILAGQERQGWDLSFIQAPEFEGLHELTAYICESGWMIGNDSGIGHLASCLGIPTLTICRSQQAANFWRPAWARGLVVTPSDWIPNIKGLRLRDKHWQKWVSVNKVLKSFSALA
jgi:heptosyltransferase III